jgi:hypothetical protein
MVDQKSAMVSSCSSALSSSRDTAQDLQRSCADSGLLREPRIEPIERCAAAGQVIRNHNIGKSWDVGQRLAYAPDDLLIGNSAWHVVGRGYRPGSAMQIAPLIWMGMRAVRLGDGAAASCEVRRSSRDQQVIFEADIVDDRLVERVAGAAHRARISTLPMESTAISVAAADVDKWSRAVAISGRRQWRPRSASIK